MVHELHRRLPALVLEKNNRPIAILAEVETDFCSDPFFRPVDHLPEYAFAGFKLENLHVETAVAAAELQLAAALALAGCKLQNLHVQPAVAEAELQLPADLAFAARGSGPPARQAVNRGQCVVDTVERCRFDSDLMQNVRHVRFSVPRCDGEMDLMPDAAAPGGTSLAGLPWTR